jgi:two-component sensor histidine kinase
MALARAHTLLSEARWSGAPLSALVRAELAAFMTQPAAAAPGGDAAGAPRARVEEGPELVVAPGAAQAFSMALHELATNATKHGALSAPGGRITVSWRVEEEDERRLHLRWTESGGPTVAGPPARRGFGSRVMEATMRDQLSGRVERRWRPGGLVCDITVPLDRVLADPEGGG